MQHFNITTPMVAYHDHSGNSQVQGLINRLLAGESIALISDAGTPLISDPGYRIVDLALSENVKVVPVPGASAAIAALSAAGLPSDRFVFEGFLNAKQQARTKQLNALVQEQRTLIFYEAPHRILACLSDIASVFGAQRQVVLARELTKTFETIKRGPIGELVEWVASDANQQRGECVVLVHGAQKNDDSTSEGRRVFDLLSDELPLKQAASLAAKISGSKKNLLYQYGLNKQKEQ